MLGRNQIQPFVIGLLTGFLLLYSYQSLQLTNNNNNNNKKKNENVFILSIKIHFKTEEGKQYFIKIFGTFADWIRKNEPGTISYELGESDSDPLELLISERYINKDAYSQVHRTSETFLAFKASMVDMNSETNRDRLGWELKGQSYKELNVGFM